MLGLAWSLAHPVVLMLVYLFVFSLLLKIQTADYDHYWLFLLAGLPVWVFFATSLQTTSRSTAREREPDPEGPLSAPARAALHGRDAGRRLRRHARDRRRRSASSTCPRPETPSGSPSRSSALVVCLVAGMSLAVASLNAVYRDVEHLVAALLLPWFFVTPVLYSLESIPAVSRPSAPRRRSSTGATRSRLRSRPCATRSSSACLPEVGDTVYLAVSAVVALVLGALVFNRVDDRVAVEV